MARKANPAVHLISTVRPAHTDLATRKGLPNPVRLTVCALLVIFALGVVLRVKHVNTVRLRTNDEVLYTNDAVMIYYYGLDDQITVARKAAYVRLLAGVMRITGLEGPEAGSWLSCAASVGSLALIAFVGARFLPPWAAIYATLTMALSLLDLVISRRCWQDALMELFGLMLVWSAIEI